jgi:YrbI family 3-deoxy-D-manno-octulosonate 8-phosphate phosphatase
MQEVLARHGVRPADACYVGDDVGDVPAMAVVGVPVAVADAVPAVRKAALYVTRARAGFGAIRELCDLILAARLKKPPRAR